MDLVSLRDAAIEAVLQVARPAFAAGASVILDKASDIVAGDVVTNVDTEVQDALSAKLLALLPGSRFVGEEDFAGLPDPAAAPTWILDPLDGTYNFSREFPCFGCALALLIDGSPAIAVVYDGLADKIYDAAQGHGARYDGEALIYDPEKAKGAPAAISSGFMQLALENPDAGLLETVTAISGRLRVFGSQAVQLCWAAAGKLKVNVNVETKLWDDAAGWLIVQEAGAAHALASGADLFPLEAGGKAVSGKSLFSISGAPDAVAKLAAACKLVAD